MIELRPTILIGIFIYLGEIASGQQSVAAAIKSNIVYVGVENPIAVAVSNYPQSKIVVEPNVGTITTTKYPGLFIWKICNKTGEGRLRIFIQEKGLKKLVDSATFRIHRLPDPDYIIVGRRGPPEGTGFVELYATHPIARSVYLDFDPVWHIKSFDIAVYKKNGDSLILHNDGPEYTEENKSVFRKM